MAKCRDQTGPVQPPQRRELGDIDHDGVLLVVVDEVGDDAVVAGCGVLHAAGAAVDRKVHDRNVGIDCDTDGGGGSGHRACTGRGYGDRP